MLRQAIQATLGAQFVWLLVMTSVIDLGLKERESSDRSGKDCLCQPFVIQSTLALEGQLSRLWKEPPTDLLWGPDGSLGQALG